MEKKSPVTREGFSAVQGCLLAAVILFVLLFGVSIVLGYRQFRENTQPSALSRVDDISHDAVSSAEMYGPATASFRRAA